MLKAFGFDEKLTLQEAVCRKAMGLIWLVIALLPLPLLGWNFLAALLMYAFYLVPLFFALHPLLAKDLKEKRTFHWLFGGTMLVAAYGPTKIAMPVIFILLCLYIMYWQLEERLYAIRRAQLEYQFEDIAHENSSLFAKELVWSSFRKALIPAAAGTLAALVCSIIPWPSGAVFTIPALIIAYVYMQRKTSLFKKR